MKRTMRKLAAVVVAGMITAGAVCDTGVTVHAAEPVIDELEADVSGSDQFGLQDTGIDEQIVENSGITGSPSADAEITETAGTDGGADDGTDMEIVETSAAGVRVGSGDGGIQSGYTTEQVEYGNSCITGFDVSFDTEIRTEYKLALESLENRFPARLTFYVGGTVTKAVYENGDVAILDVEGYTKRTIRSEWKCVQDYDEELGEYEFRPELPFLEHADGLSIPAIRVTVENEGKALQAETYHMSLTMRFR